MSYILTLVASSGGPALSESHINSAAGFFEGQGLSRTCAPVWLHPGKAADVGISRDMSLSELNALRNFLQQERIDVFCGPVERRRKKLLLADMDSTIVKAETLDELAAEANLKEQIADITARAMNGEIDFHAAIRSRVSLLKGLPVAALERTLERMELNPGAEVLVRTMAHHGSRTVLVTGGFTFFSERIGKRAGFQHHHANVLGVSEDRLTGEVREPILDKNAKVDALNTHCKELGIRTDQAIAIGDGANDLPMLKIAGTGIGYMPKRLVAEEVKNIIVHSDLSSALYAQGYTEQHIRDAIA